MGLYYLSLTRSKMEIFFNLVMLIFPSITSTEKTNTRLHGGNGDDCLRDLANTIGHFYLRPSWIYSIFCYNKYSFWSLSS